MGLKKKRAQMLGVVSALAVASLVSVGFAAWTISTTRDGSGSGNITADYNVTDESIGELNPASGNSAQNIVFGAPSSTAQASIVRSNTWLSATGNPPEQLTATFSWTFLVGADHTGPVTISGFKWFDTEVANSHADYEYYSGYTTYSQMADVLDSDGAVTNAGLLGALPKTLTEGTPAGTETSPFAKYKLENSGQNYTLTISIGLWWGHKFATSNTTVPQNPFKYFGDKGPTSSNISEAIAKINNSETGLGKLGQNGIKLKFTFTIS